MVHILKLFNVDHVYHLTYLPTYLLPTVEVPADLVDQSTGGLSVSVAGEAIALSSKLTWDLFPIPGK